jgi:hypothetical protein
MSAPLTAPIPCVPLPQLGVVFLRVYPERCFVPRGRQADLGFLDGSAAQQSQIYAISPVAGATRRRRPAFLRADACRGGGYPHEVRGVRHPRG